MRDSIAVIMAVLGVLLVLAGGTLLVLNALAAGAPLPTRKAAPPAATDEPTDELAVPPAKTPVTARLTDAARRLPSADRLIGWGIILLVLAAIAAGAITFNFQLAANSGT